MPLHARSGEISYDAKLTELFVENLAEFLLDNGKR